MTIGERLKLIRGTLSQEDFSKQLGVSKAAVGAYERDAQMPGSAFIIAVCRCFQVAHTWLLVGEGPMSAAEGTSPPPQSVPPPQEERPQDCARCLRLEAKLDRIEQQRDELVLINQQLLMQNGDLKALCATLEERQKHFDPTGFFSKHPIIASSKPQFDG